MDKSITLVVRLVVVPKDGLRKAREMVTNLRL